MGGVQCATKESLRSAIDTEIMEDTQNRKYQAVRKLPERWQRCIDVEGEYL